MTVRYVVLISAAVLMALYLLAIRPRLGRRKQFAPFRGVYYAHRGLYDNASGAPENSLPAFKKAVKAGYGIEVDVQLTKDGVPVAFHDFTLERACGQPGRLCEYTYEELQKFSLFQSGEKIPPLKEVLKLAGGKTPLIVELKVEWMDLAVCACADRLLREYKGPYCVQSFHPLVLTWYRRYHNDVLRGQLSDGFLKTGEFKGAGCFVMQNLLLNWVTKPDFISYHYKFADNLSLKLCRRLYKAVTAAWTIQSREELAAARKEFDLILFDSFVPGKSPAGS